MAFTSAQLEKYAANRTVKDRSVLCHAPFTNINFVQNGSARVCCYNWSRTIGEYPRDSIHEMWYGEAAQRLRSEMGPTSMPEGCELCANQLESGNILGLRAKGFDQYAADSADPVAKQSRPAMPVCMEFELSNVCNLECTMCDGFWSSSIRRNVEKLPPMPQRYDSAFVEQLDEFLPNLQAAKFLGGEPFLIPLYYEIWTRIAAVNPGIKCHITTNGTVLNSRVKRALDGIDGTIVVSMDSPDAASFEAIRVRAKHARVVENMQYFADYSKERGASLSIAVCPMQQNWRHLPGILDFCDRFEAAVYFNTVFRPPEATLQSLTSNELAAVVQHLRSGLDEKGSGNARRRDNELRYRDMIAQIESWAKGAVLAEASNRGALDRNERVRARYDHLRAALEKTGIDSAWDESEVYAVAEALMHEAAWRSERDPIETDRADWYVEPDWPEPGLVGERILAEREKLVRALEELYQHMDAHRFLTTYFDILNRVASVLQGSIHVREGADLERILSVRDAVLKHPKMRLAAEAMIRAPGLHLIRMYSEVPLTSLMDALEQIPDPVDREIV